MNNHATMLWESVALFLVTYHNVGATSSPWRSPRLSTGERAVQLVLGCAVDPSNHKIIPAGGVRYLWHHAEGVKLQPR